jgi:hypothetical protein
MSNDVVIMGEGLRQSKNIGRVRAGNLYHALRVTRYAGLTKTSSVMVLVVQAPNGMGSSLLLPERRGGLWSRICQTGRIVCMYISQEHGIAWFLSTYGGLVKARPTLHRGKPVS